MLENRDGLSRNEPPAGRSRLNGTARRKGEKEGGSFSKIAFHPDFAAMRLDDMFDDRKPEAGSSLIPRTRLVHAVKPLKNTVERLRRNAWAIVPHIDLNFPAFNLLAAHLDFALHAAVF